MVDEVKVQRICDEIGASRDEALYYLEGFDWNLDSAMEACRIKTLPPAKVKSSPEVSVNEQSTPVNYTAKPITIIPPGISNPSSSTPPPRMIGSSRSSNQVPGNELPPELQKELIVQFREVDNGLLSVQETVEYLQRFNWHLRAALNHYMEQRYPQHVSNKDAYDGDDDDDYDDVSRTIDQSYLHRFQEGHIPMIGVSNLEGFSQDETSTALAMDVMEHRGPSLPSLSLPSHSQFHASVGYQMQDYTNKGQAGTSSSCSMDVEADEELIPVPVMSSSQVQIQGSSSSAQIREDHPPPYKVDRICNETGVCRDEALYYLESFDWDLASAMEACRTKTLPPPKVKPFPGVSVNESSAAPVVINSRRISNEMQIQPEELPPKKNDGDIIKSFCDIAGTSPDDAVYYLNCGKWNVNTALDLYMEKHFGNPKGDHLTDVPLTGPSESQFQASGSSASSLKINDPTETEESLKEGSDESVTVAFTPMASSQVDRKLKGKAVEEDSSTETLPDPSAIQDRRTVVGLQAEPTTITVSINLADSTSGIPVDIPFRSNQTIRDIRNAIDERKPDSNRDYELHSADRVECDLNKTVDKICIDGSAILFQIFP